MTIVAVGIALLAVAIIVICLWGLWRPRWIFGVAATVLQQPWLMPVAVGVRLALGLALLSVASASAMPLLFRAVGWLSIVAALALPFIGVPRIRRLIAWIDTLSPWVMHLWMGFGIALGAALLAGLRPVLW